MVDNPNVDPSIRPQAPKVEDLKEKFREILIEEFEGVALDNERGSWDLHPEINKAVERLYDAVTQTAMMDPHD